MNIQFLHSSLHGRGSLQFQGIVSALTLTAKNIQSKNIHSAHVCYSKIDNKSSANLRIRMRDWWNPELPQLQNSAISTLSLLPNLKHYSTQLLYQEISKTHYLRGIFGCSLKTNRGRREENKN